MKLERVLLLLLAQGGVLGLGCSGSVEGDGSGAGAAPKGSPGIAPGNMPGTGKPPGTGGSGMTGAGGATMTMTMPPPLTGAAADQAGLMPLRRLTQLEHRYTLRDLQLGVNAVDVTKDVPEDTRGAFGFDLAPTVSNLEVDRFLAVAEQVGKSVAANAKLLAMLVPCTPAMGDETCARGFITSFGRRAYRRPLAADEATALVDYYKSVRTGLGYDFTNGIRMVLQVMLQSPNFLYRWELGGQAAAAKAGVLIKLNSHEMASRLSYFLWSTMPDQKLFTAADMDSLQTPTQIAAEASRLVADPKAKDTITRFHDQWLDLEKLPAVQKDPKILLTFRDILTAMGTETRTFINHVFAEGNGSLELLVGAPYTFINEALAKHYGIANVTGKEFRKVDLDVAQRTGVLTQGAFLSIQSPPNSTSPVRRGKVVLENFLCTPPPPPPEGLDVQPPPPDPKLQVREQFAQHTTEPSCRACHIQMDMIGFTFESFDTVGRFRTDEAGKPVNASADIPNIDGKTVKVKGAAELMKVLSTSDQVRQCLVKQWMRFAMGRLEAPEEAGSLKAAYDEFAAAKYDMRVLLVALAKTRAFQNRSPNLWEVTP